MLKFSSQTFNQLYPSLPRKFVVSQALLNSFILLAFCGGSFASPEALDTQGIHYNAPPTNHRPLADERKHLHHPAVKPRREVRPSLKCALGAYMFNKQSGSYYSVSETLRICLPLIHKCHPLGINVIIVLSNPISSALLILI